MIRKAQLLCALFLVICSLTQAQTFMIWEQTNKAKTTRFYVGDKLTFSFDGEEKYWYTREIKDIIPETNSLMLDNYWVKIEDIAAIKMPPKPINRIIGGALISFGSSLIFATTMAFLYGDDTQNYPLILGGSGVSLVASRYTLKKRKINLGERHRLRIVVIPLADAIPETP